VPAQTAQHAVSHANTGALSAGDSLGFHEAFWVWALSFGRSTGRIVVIDLRMNRLFLAVRTSLVFGSSAAIQIFPSNAIGALT
jgi:hypothetical protein